MRIVIALEQAALILQQPGHDVDDSCIIILQWISCFYRYPPCLNYKLLLPCADICGKILTFFVLCHDVIETQVDDVPVRLHFRSLGCRIAETYYDGYNNKEYFINDDSQCFEPLNVFPS